MTLPSRRSPKAPLSLGQALNKGTKIRNSRKRLMATSYLKKPMKMVIAVSTSKKTLGNFILVKPLLG